MSMNRTIRRLAFPASVCLGGALAAVNGARLASYDVPPLLIATCVLCIWGTFSTFFAHVMESLTTTTHRCREAGCDFRVRLTNVDSDEDRCWREIAAAHPSHGYRP